MTSKGAGDALLYRQPRMGEELNEAHLRRAFGELEGVRKALPGSERRRR